MTGLEPGAWRAGAWRAGAPGLRDPTRLLAAWDAASAVPDVVRGPMVLAACGMLDTDPLDTPLDRLGELALRCLTEAFGAAVDGVATCAACSGTLELTLDLTTFAAPGAPGVAGALPGREVELGTGQVTVRVPTVRDLLAAAPEADPVAVLVARCVHDDGGRPVDAVRLTERDLAVLDAVLEELTGAGLTTLRTTCPDCAGEVVAVLDPAALLWNRVGTAAPNLLRDVAQLAAVFGWSEADVLAMSPARRRAYLVLAS